LPADLDRIYAIFDNLSAHRASDVLLFSLQHPRWEFVFQLSVFDLNAAILHCLGIDPTRLTYKYQGHYLRLADVHGDVVRKILA
jgi:Protein of unknown function (DUF1501)